MKKEEALKIAPKRSKLLCEYIIQILSDKEKVKGEIKISSAKINNERMITLDIWVPSKGFERHFNTGITVQQVDVLTEQIFDAFIKYFMESDFKGCTRYYSVRGGYGMNMDGVTVVNAIGSKVNVNFICRGVSFDEQASKYNLRLDEYVNQQENNMKLK